MEKAALVIVDVQRDFLPGGNLAVPEGDQIVPVINKLMTKFSSDNIVSTKDSHPADHGSFASTHGVDPFTMGELGGRPQMMWPDHCVAETDGWLMAENLDRKALYHVVYKGEDKDFDSYSGFKDDGGKETSLKALLNGMGLIKGSRIYVCGLATDYCVKATAIDGKAAGFDVYVVLDACRGVARDSILVAIEEMRDAEVVLVNSDQINL